MRPRPAVGLPVAADIAVHRYACTCRRPWRQRQGEDAPVAAWPKMEGCGGTGGGGGLDTDRGDSGAAKKGDDMIGVRQSGGRPAPEGGGRGRVLGGSGRGGNPRGRGR